MLWYLADGSLNDYLKSQVLLQSEYYTGYPASLQVANYESHTGIAVFEQFTLKNKPGLFPAELLNIDNIKVTLTNNPIKQLSTASIANKTTTLVNLESLQLGRVKIWVSSAANNATSLNQQQTFIINKLAKDFPALYPKVSAKLYAQKYPERSEQLALQSMEVKAQATTTEKNQAVIIAKQNKQQKRLLGKAQTRLTISAISIEQLSVYTIVQGTTNVEHFTNISLGSLGGEHGLASNQLGGELLNRLMTKAISLQ